MGVTPNGDLGKVLSKSLKAEGIVEELAMHPLGNSPPILTITME